MAIDDPSQAWTQNMMKPSRWVGLRKQKRMME